MPELPDVEVYRRYFNATALHKKIDTVEIDSARVVKGYTQKNLRKELEERSFEQTRRHGKFMFAELDNGRFLLLHFGMTGDLKYFKDRKKEPEHTRVLFAFKNGYHLAYICRRLLGEVSVIDSVDDFKEKRELGPDALDLEIDDFIEILEDKRGSLKTTLMNQKYICGIGNIYADEIVFQAGFDPRSVPAKMDRQQLKKLYQKMRKVLQTAVEKKVTPDNFPPNFLIGRREEGTKCPGCGGRIKKIKISGRSAYLCPKCQEKI